MQSAVVMFTFFDFNRKCHFLVNLVQKIKIVSLLGNLVRLPFLSKFGSTNQNCLFKLKFGI